MFGSFKQYVVLIAALTLLLPLAALAQAEENSNWTVDIQPYLFAASLDGDSTVAGKTVPVDLDFNDIMDNLNYGFNMRVEAWHTSNWGFVVDFMVLDVSLGGPVQIGNPEPGPPPVIGADIDVSLGETSLDLLGAYRIKQNKMVYDMFGGLRLVHLKQSVDITPLNLPMEGPSLGGTESWIEPVIGARASWLFSDKWLAMVRGDVSGFGIGDASDLTYNLMAGIGFQPTDQIGLRFAYRYYAIDYTTGSGDDDEFALDASFQGPWIGLSFIL